MADTVFQDGTVWRNSKLDMVNVCLEAIGESYLIDGTIIDNLPPGSDGDIAKRIVENTMVEVQARGWYFNMDYNFLLEPDIDGFISLPGSALRVDFGNGPDRHQYTFKNGMIYDYLNKTFKIEKLLEADIVWLTDYNNLTIDAYNYISLRAARKAQQRLIGSSDIDAFTARDEVDALNNLMRAQLQTQDYKLRNNRVSTRIHNGWLIKGLYGNTNRREF